ncbi:hypothetical protein WKW77_28245 [Variovorax ureilyticus]|uniref:Uncharacterized protein n=1 Tax=Variovorax ureilyticus TaxID=1836198 RepID=A0ABU8VNT7_9BURK
MKPVLAIRRVEPDAYSYRISDQEAGGTFASIEHCLVDAAASLGHYFTSVELNLEGLFLGACALDALRRAPRAVAQRIEQHFQPA